METAINAYREETDHASSFEIRSAKRSAADLFDTYEARLQSLLQDVRRCREQFNKTADHLDAVKYLPDNEEQKDTYKTEDLRRLVSLVNEATRDIARAADRCSTHNVDIVTEKLLVVLGMHRADSILATNLRALDTE